MRVLVVRAPEAASRTADALAARGHAALVAPIVAIVPTGEAAPAGPHDALVATSANAALALDGRLALPGFAVGVRTSAALRAAGIAVVTATDGDAAALADRIRRDLTPGAALLLVAGRDRKAEPERSLRAAGFRVAVWTAYAAEILPRLPDAAREALAEGRADAVLHYSRRSAAHLHALAGRAGLLAPFVALRHVCLSDDVAAALPGCEDVVVAARPDEAALLAALDGEGPAGPGSRPPQSRC